MFFIFGSPRSGTTLLAQCLNAHTKILVPHETDFMIPLAFTFHRIQNPELGKDILQKLITHSTAFPNSLGEYLSEKQVVEIIQACDYHPAKILNALYGALASAAKKTIAGDKSPNDLMNVPVLVKTGALDEASMKIIHIVRDVRDIMVSLSRVGWGADSDVYFPRFWSSSNLYLHALYQNKKRLYFFLRYEDMVREPELTFQQICHFLEVEYEPAMFDSSKFNPRYKNIPAHSKLYNPISTENIGVYKTQVPSALLRSYEKQAGEALEIFGYPLEAPKTLVESIKSTFSRQRK